MKKLIKCPACGEMVPDLYRHMADLDNKAAHREPTPSRRNGARGGRPRSNPEPKPAK